MTKKQQEMQEKLDDLVLGPPAKVKAARIWAREKGACGRQRYIRTLGQLLQEASNFHDYLLDDYIVSKGDCCCGGCCENTTRLTRLKKLKKLWDSLEFVDV